MSIHSALGYRRYCNEVDTPLDEIFLGPSRNDTPFDDLPPTAVLRPKDIADRLLVDPRSVRRAILRG